MAYESKLKRTLPLPLVILYGLGTTIGAGIYVLIGEIARVADYHAPASFLVASLMAGFTAMSFAELSGRYPYAAGASFYVKNGFNSVPISTLVGLLVALSGVVSAAAMINGFTGYLHDLLHIDRSITIITTVVILGSIAAWGIVESVTIASLVTLIEVGGLLLIIWTCRDGLGNLPARWQELVPPFDPSSWSSLGAGAVLAFYAFIGFEDMVDIAEEVKHVERNLPAAIIWTLIITTILYILLSIAIVLSLPLSEIIESEAPLAHAYHYQTNQDSTFISFISMFAIINGALIQLIMSSRVLYGLGSRKQLPALLSKVNPLTQTPLLATTLVTLAILIFALIGSLASLAEITSLTMLCVFALINLALINIKSRNFKSPPVKTYSMFVPFVGFIISTAFFLGSLIKWITQWHLLYLPGPVWSFA